MGAEIDDLGPKAYVPCIGWGLSCSQPMLHMLLGVVITQTVEGDSAQVRGTTQTISAYLVDLSNRVPIEPSHH